MYVPASSCPLFLQLEEAFVNAQKDPAFRKRPGLPDCVEKLTPGVQRRLTLCCNLTRGTRTTLYLKREDLLHGGAHKPTRVLGQALLAKRMGKTGNHCRNQGPGSTWRRLRRSPPPLFGLKCRIYMGAKDIERQSPNVFRMRLMRGRGDPGTQRFRDPERCLQRGPARLVYEKSHFMLGTAAGPHPFRCGCHADYLF